MLGGEALRVVLDTHTWRSGMNIAELDGRIGEGWGGLSPNGCHVNVVLAHRGSPTAAAAISMFAHPSPGHTPVLVLRRRVAARIPADLAADADDEQGDRERRPSSRR